MQVASDSCEAWTLVVPPAAAGHYRISGSLFFTNAELAVLPSGSGDRARDRHGDGRAIRDELPRAILGAGGPPQRYDTSVRVARQIRPATGTDGCRLRIDAGMEQIVTYQRSRVQIMDGHPPGTDTKCRRVILRFIRMAGADHHLEGASEWSNQNPKRRSSARDTGRRITRPCHCWTASAATTPVTCRRSSPAMRAGMSYYSDRPRQSRLRSGRDRRRGGHMRVEPCAVHRPVTDGACAAFVVPPSDVLGNSGARYGVELRDEEGLVIAESSTDIGSSGAWPPWMSLFPCTIVSGSIIPIDVSTAAGAPAAYEVVVSPVSVAASGWLTSAQTVYQGVLAPSIGGGDGPAVDVSDRKPRRRLHGTSGRRSPTSSVSTSTATKRISVVPADTQVPRRPAPRRGFVTKVSLASGSIQTRIPWSGSDVGIGIARYELHQQTNGGHVVDGLDDSHVTIRDPGPRDGEDVPLPACGPWTRPVTSAPGPMATRSGSRGSARPTRGSSTAAHGPSPRPPPSGAAR